MKFKIGDKVRCINVPEVHNYILGIHGYGWKLGKEFIINRISNLNGGEGNKKEPIYWSDYGVYEVALELVEKRKLDISHIKQYGVVKFLNSLEK